MLELKNLTFEVPLADGSKETKRIIDDLSLTIPDGRFTVITGPNGGGKSTLAKLIMGVARRAARSCWTARTLPTCPSPSAPRRASATVSNSPHASRA